MSAGFAFTRRAVFRTVVSAVPWAFLPNVPAAAEPSNIKRLPLQLAEQLMHCTTRIEMEELGRSGTGFFYYFYKTDQGGIPAIITNKHVIDGASTIRFRLHRRNEDLPDLAVQTTIEIRDLQSRIAPHPEVDLVAILIGDILTELTAQGKPPFYISVDQSLIPTQAQFEQLLPLEQVLTVGYPGQLWDDVNNLPLFHRGSTATAPYIDFRGHQEFLIDLATWPGASGSPVFIYNSGDYQTRDNILLGSRIIFVGIVYGVAVQEVTGNVVIHNGPTTYAPTAYVAASNVPTNLGACVRSSRVLEIEPILSAKFGVAAPPGYVSRVKP